MKTPAPIHQTAIAVVTLFCAIPLPPIIAQDGPPGTPAEEARKAGMEQALGALAKTAGNLVGAYNRRDAAAIAALFTPGGEFVGSDGRAHVGRQAIEACHKQVFTGDDVPRIALEALEVRLIAPGVAIEEGLVHATLGEEEPLRSFAYTATHVRQADGSWLIASSRNLAEVSSPAEQIKPLHWLIGEWTLEGDDGLRVDMVIHLDDGENHLLGEALVTDAEQSVQTTSLRIGWNPATASVYWWTFDSGGGNASGPWVRSGDQWILKTIGITADAEATSSSQTLIRDGDTMVWKATARMLAGGAQPDLNYRFVRRAPNPLSLLTSEDAGQTRETGPASTKGGE